MFHPAFGGTERKGKIMKRVAQYDPKTGERIAVYVSIAAAAGSIFHGDSAAISRACRGVYAQAYGYRWKFVRLNAYGEYVAVPAEKHAAASHDRVRRQVKENP